MGAFERTPPPRVPGEVANLVWNDATSLSWDEVTSAVMYHVYRTTLAALTYSDFGQCRDDLDPDQTDTMLSDATLPGSGEVLVYSITAEDASGQRSTLGLGTCAERSNFSVCP